MKSLFKSLFFHGLFFTFGLFTLWYKRKVSPPVIITSQNLCTLPLEIEAISDISQAPPSQPKTQSILNQEGEVSLVPQKEEKPDVKKPDLKEETKKEDVKKPDLKEETKKEDVKKPDLKKEIKKKNTSSEKETIDPLKKKDFFKKSQKKKDSKEKNIPLNDVLSLPSEPSKKTQKNVSKAEASSSHQPHDLISQALKKKPSSKKVREKLQSLLKDLGEDQQGSSSQTPVTDPHSTSPYGAPHIGPMAISIIDRVKRLLEESWHVPLRAIEGGDLIVVVRIAMNPNGTVRQAHVLHDQSTSHHPAYQVAVESALRAVERFRYQSLPFSPKAYESWKIFDFRFIRSH